ncbi:hypothetical protein C3486_14215 [Streptomyces sp. Ru73]|nr:hypothetical protein C3486_14215 [Streptomyces sp. Ru73]
MRLVTERGVGERAPWGGGRGRRGHGEGEASRWGGGGGGVEAGRPGAARPEFCAGGKCLRRRGEQLAHWGAGDGPRSRTTAPLEVW